MSLINEALKRAEAEKYRDCGGPAYKPPTVPHAHHVRLPRRWVRGLALCCGLIAVTTLGMWTMVDHSRRDYLMIFSVGPIFSDPDGLRRAVQAVAKGTERGLSLRGEADPLDGVYGDQVCRLC